MQRSLMFWYHSTTKHSYNSVRTNPNQLSWEDQPRTYKNYPDSEITLTQSIDESLIGGYVVKVGYKEFDHSYEGRLRQLERKLTGR